MRARALLPGFLVAAACAGTPADTGLDATMRVSGAQFFRGTMPAAQDGPEVESVDLITNDIHAGFVDKAFKGALAASATAAALQLEGDPGYWIVPAGVPDVSTPTFPSVAATLSFSGDLLPGAYPFTVRAVDGDGHFGAPNVTTLNATEQGLPQGTLVVSLAWDTEADLDLHVVDANGAEVYWGNINSWVPPGPGQPPAAPDAWQQGGILDFDSNAHCVIDGVRREHVVWTQPPPTGHYVVRVDASSLCGQPFAHWSVVAYLAGQALAQARGTALDADTRGDHGRGAGITAVELDVH
ncbi:MAG TPA: hypothetical protein VIF09_02700 [Polyangiaceae bacterium]